MFESDQIVQAAGDAFVVSDADGKIRMWNPAAVRIFGFTEAEALGQSLDLITPERQRGRHWEGFFKTMRTGKTRYGTDVLRVPALHKEGRSLSIAFTVGLLFGPDELVTGIVAIIRDDTARFLEDRQMRRRLADLEAGATSPPVQHADRRFDIESPASHPCHATTVQKRRMSNDCREYIE